MNQLRCLWICMLLALLICHNFVIVNAKTPNAAVPRSKSGKKGRWLTGNNLVTNLFREAKISFCSELEGLLLQVFLYQVIFYTVTIFHCCR